MQRYQSSLKQFFLFLKKENFIQQIPTWINPKIQSQHSLPKTLEYEEILQLIQFTPKSKKEYRDKAIIELLYSSALRLQELVDLDIEHLDFHNECVLIKKGKGNQTRYVPIGSYAIQSLQSWLHHHPNPKKESPLFTSTQLKRIHPRTIQYLIKKYTSKFLQKNDISPHYFRHSCASHLLESSQNIRAVQEILGHKNLNTTQIYTEVNFSYLANVYDKTHPKAKKNK